MYYLNDDVFIHACEAYLAGAMYTKDFSQMLMGEPNKAIEDALRDYGEKHSNPNNYEEEAKNLAKLLWKVKLEEEYKKIDKKITEARPW